MSATAPAPRTKRRKTSSSATRGPKLPTDRGTQWAAAVVAGKVVAGPHIRNACRRHLDDLRLGHERGLTYSIEKVERVCRFYEQKLRLNGGQFEGRPFLLHPSQAFKLGNIFGWLRADGTRRFRRAYIEEGKGNGKSPFIGGVGLYGMMADSEPGAEIYAVAAHRDQAKILFNDAVSMVEQSPDLESRITMSGGPGRRYNMAWLKTSSFFKPLSRSAGKSGSGLRPHMGLADEMHEHPNRDAVEMIERGFKFRRQPLLAMITNSGTDRNSICWEEHEHAVRVAAGNPDAKDDDPAYLGVPLDDTTFSFVCSLDGPRTFSSFDAVEHMQTYCTCHSVPTTRIERLTEEVFASHATSHGTAWRAVLAALSTPSVQSSKLGYATDATSEGLNSEHLREGPESGSIRSGGRKRTQTTCATTSGDGLQNAPDTASGKRKSKLSANMEWETSSSTLWLLRRMGDALSAPSLSRSASTTVTGPDNSEDCFASNAILRSVYSEIIQKLFNAHSPTCIVRKSELKNGSLRLPGDDPLNDPSCWPKANPLLGVTITEDYLADVVAQAKAIPGKLNGILRLHFCVWTDAEAAWMTRAVLEPCLADFDPAIHHGKRIAQALDLSQSRDITAKASVVETGSVPVTVIVEGEPVVVEKPTYDAWIEAWTPGDTLAARATRDKAPYEVWAREGHIHAPPGQSIRFDHVAQSLADDDRDFDIGMVGYDRYAFRRFENEVHQLGLSIPFVEHPQGGTKKGKPTEDMIAAAKAENREPEGLWMPGSLRALEEAMLERRIRLKINPVLISAIMSAVTDEDRWENRWLAKERAANKIDAAVALAMALGVAMAMPKSNGVDAWIASMRG